MKISNKVVAVVGAMFALTGCDAPLSSEDRQEIESLKAELAETRKALAEHKKSTEVDSGHALNEKNKEIVFTPTGYQSDIDKDFRELASRFDGLEVYSLPDTDIYRVIYTSKRSGMAVTKELFVPLLFFRAVYDPEGQHSQDILRKMASRGYRVEFIRLFEQGKYITEKKAILALYSEGFLRMENQQ